MAQLQITIDIAPEPLTGHQHHKLAAAHGEENAAVIGRICKANQDAAGHRSDPVDVLLQAFCKAVRASEA